jgi:hypothetical protein
MPVRVLNAGDAPQRDVVRIESPQREVVEVVDDGHRTLLVTEPVFVDADALQVRLDELADVEADTAPSNVPLILVRSADGSLFTVQAMPPIAPPKTSYQHDQIVTAELWQIHHELGFDPAGVVVQDYDGSLIEPDTITYPLPDYVELRFGVPVAGRAWLS